MQKNLYFRTVLRRQNVLKTFLLDCALNVASQPRLLLECFLRKNFGLRYFSLSSAITVSFIVGVLPIILHKATSSLARLTGNGGGDSFWGNYATWYMFLIAFMYFAWQRHLEIRRNPSVFDFTMVSTYAGDIHPFFRSVRIAGKLQSIRSIEILLEPGVFFGAGMLLALIGQPLGWLLILSALAYSFSYQAAYREGDNFILDLIDNKHYIEQMNNAFVHDNEGRPSRGVRFYMRKPSSRTVRDNLSGSFIENDSWNDDMPLSVAQ
jgi:hypothetical protein